MLHYKCLIRQDSTTTISLILHAESIEDIKTNVESAFGEGSLLYSEPFRI